MRKIPNVPCPECWAPMQQCMTMDAFECTLPHGTLGTVRLGSDGYIMPPEGRCFASYTRPDGSRYWMDDAGRKHELRYTGSPW